MTNILHITASANPGESMTNKLAAEFITALKNSSKVNNKIIRDVSKGMPFVTPEWVGANFTPEENRTDDQKEVLRFSDELISEIEESNLVVISLPIYNFGIPATMKAWVDMVARARKTFKYTEKGPLGLLTGKKAIIFVASGGTKVGSEIDFATPYMLQALKFIGITDVEIISADAQSSQPDVAKNALQQAKDHAALLAA